MNIFVVGDNACPYASAHDLCDQHVSKMLLETAQILCSVAHRYGMPAPYRPTHMRHPCVMWAGDGHHNWCWLVDHAQALATEFTARFGKAHKSAAVIDDVILGRGVPTALSRGEGLCVPIGMPVTIGMPDIATPFAQAMPEQYRGHDAVEAYRRYYRAEKASMARWDRRGGPPDWFAAPSEGSEAIAA